MYVNPFWMGVFTAVVVEILACIAYAVIAQNRGGKK